MNNTDVRFAVKVGMFLTMLSTLMLPVAAQTWQSTGKMAAIPIVAANTACTGLTDTVGITADRSTLLTCQAGSWKKVTGSTNTLNCESALPGATCLTPEGGTVKLVNAASRLVTMTSDQGSATYGSFTFKGATSITDGATNTALIKNDSPAAQFCTSIWGVYGTGWFLPARNQLQMIYDNRVVMGSYLGNYHWSSTEFNAIQAQGMVDQDGTWYDFTKTNEFRVRCVRILP